MITWDLRRKDLKRILPDYLEWGPVPELAASRSPLVYFLLSSTTQPFCSLRLLILSTHPVCSLLLVYKFDHLHLASWLLLERISFPQQVNKSTSPHHFVSDFTPARRCRIIKFSKARLLRALSKMEKPWPSSMLPRHQHGNGPNWQTPSKRILRRR